MIHALPGVGADHRMFPLPWHCLPQFIAHDWPPFEGESTIEEVAARLCREFYIRDGDIVVGASLGGMVACEIAKLRQLEAIYLVGSSTCNTEISQLLNFLHPVARVTPFDWLRFCAEKIPKEVCQMFASGEPQFVRAMCAAIYRWV
jgi:hypothetical protein